MKCKKCGHENDDNAKFCNDCGAKIYKNKNINYIGCMKNIYTKVRIPKIKFSNISKKMKIGIIILLGIILIGCIGGYLYYDNYKYRTGYNLTDEEKNRNINNELSKSNYDKAEILANNYFIDNKRNSYFAQIELCKSNKINSLNDLTEEKKLSSINEKLAEGNYDEATKLVYSYFTDSNTCNIYFKDIQLCKSNKFTSLEEGDKVREENEYKTEMEKRKADEEVRKAEENLRAIQEKIRKQDEEIAKQQVNRKKGASIGMTKEEVLNSSLGKPDKVHTTVTKYGVDEQWVYGSSIYLYFENGKLTSMQN